MQLPLKMNNSEFYNYVKRIFDLSIVIILLPILIISMILISFAIKLTSEGPIFFWSKRIGYKNRIFLMPKFRTMKTNAPIVATHLMKKPDEFLYPIGKCLRQTSLDEIPQIWSIFIGDMSFVGPRPALFNQDDLINLRAEKGVNKLIPGLTGWAQVNGRDELPIPDKVSLDFEYLEKRSFWFDIYIIWLTLLKVLKKENITH
tara:strand:- start:2614 stop:3219 length:606 start_codon:yes stop_codon:yes gene_type:complete